MKAKLMMKLILMIMNMKNKLIKNKVKEEFDSSSRSERRLYYKVLNQLTPNLFYKD
jgi:hypothetical protein